MGRDRLTLTLFLQNKETQKMFERKFEIVDLMMR